MSLQNTRTTHFKEMSSAPSPSPSNLHPLSLHQGIELRVELIAGGLLSVSCMVSEALCSEMCKCIPLWLSFDLEGGGSSQPNLKKNKDY